MKTGSPRLESAKSGQVYRSRQQVLIPLSREVLGTTVQLTILRCGAHVAHTIRVNSNRTARVLKLPSVSFFCLVPADRAWQDVANRLPALSRVPTKRLPLA